MPEPSLESEIAELRKQLQEQDRFILRAQDREIGLEQELATARAGSNREAVVAELAAVKASASYQFGRALTLPFRALSALLRFAMRVLRAIARRGRGWLQAKARSKR
jgi:hypothetical protein